VLEATNLQPLTAQDNVDCFVKIICGNEV